MLPLLTFAAASISGLLNLTRPRNAIFLADGEKPKSRCDSQTIREQIGALTDKVQAIIDLASEDGRDLTKDEKAEIDAIIGSGKKGEDGYQPGQIGALEADLERAERLEKRIADNALRRGNPGGGIQQRADGPETRPEGEDAPRATQISVPAKARHRYASLKAFKGQHAEQEAYLSGQFLLATIYDHEPAKKWCREHGVDMIKGAQSEGINTAGGYLVPTEMDQRIIDLREQYGVFRQNAFVSNMTSDTKDVPRRTGGVTAYFVGENDEITASDKSWDGVSLVAKKLAALVRYSSELSEDAVISMADDLTNEIAYAFALKEDQCGFIGDGTSTYGGIVGVKDALAAGSYYEALAGNTAFSTLDLADFESMVGMLPQYAEANAKWYISKPGYAASMLRLIDAAGGNTTREIEGGSQMMMFLGYPVVISQVMNSTLTAQTSTSGLVHFGDLRMAATLGNRRGTRIKVSEERYFEFDQIGIQGTERFDINVHERGDANNAGAIVSLKTPGA